MAIPHKPSQPREFRFQTKFGGQENLVATLNDDHQTIEDGFAKLRQAIRDASDAEAIAALEARVAALEARPPEQTIIHNDTTVVTGEPTPDELTPDQKAALAGSYGHPSNTNPYVTHTDPRLKPNTALSVPVGTVLDYAGAGEAPSGWLFCDGASLLQGDFRDLFAVIGVTYGGDATHFNLPDCRGRSTMGPGTVLGVARAVGAKFGAESHLLTGPQSGVKAHSHTFPWYKNSCMGGSDNDTGSPLRPSAPPTTDTITTSVNTAEDASQVHPNVHPVIVFPKIIKV